MEAPRLRGEMLAAAVLVGVLKLHVNMNMQLEPDTVDVIGLRLRDELPVTVFVEVFVAVEAVEIVLL